MIEKLSESIQEELNVETAFTIPLFGGIDVAESTVIMWVIMAVLTALCLLLTRGFTVRNPGKRQTAVESFVNFVDNMTGGMLGEEAAGYKTYIGTVLIFLAAANMMGLFGIKPPTKDLSVTGAIAIMSIVIVQIAGIRKKGVGGWLKSFTQPIAVVTPINILELAIKPLSLCMRLFGNILGAFVIMELIKQVVPLVVPMVLGLYFDIFDALIQAYVFCFLTSLYIKEAVE